MMPCSYSGVKSTIIACLAHEFDILARSWCESYDAVTYTWLSARAQSQWLPRICHLQVILRMYTCVGSMRKHYSEANGTEDTMRRRIWTSIRLSLGGCIVPRELLQTRPRVGVFLFPHGYCGTSEAQLHGCTIMVTGL